MKLKLVFVFIFFSLSIMSFAKNNCLRCHKGIEHIREPNSKMMKEIYNFAKKAGYKDNSCIVCHGGNPDAIKKEKAHNGTIKAFLDGIKFEGNVVKGPQNFYPDPGSVWINKFTCGICHKTEVKTQYTSLMFTEAGKIQGALWGFGGLEGYQHTTGNYNVHTLKPNETAGSNSYKNYIKHLKKLNPQVRPEKMAQVSTAPTPEEVEKNPQLAVYTYLRQGCLRCHTGNKGRQKRGDFRGLGCSSCHIPYSNEGYYEGNDPTIPKNKKGWLLTHQIQGTREARVKIHGVKYSGIPVETCTSCHDRGKRIGTSFQGLMETSYSSPFLNDGSDQPKLHTKHYLHLHADIHMQKGMLCQDCHTSLDIHSDGNLVGTTLASVEIECQDCHGTPDKFPWELPLGYGDEHKEKPETGKPRGLTKKLLPFMKKGTSYPAEDGYLLTARGNPFGNVVKKGNEIIVHTAGGKDLKLTPLKELAKLKKLNPEAIVAMVHIKAHMDRMECYTCHAKWAPQCYGCHIKIDYSKKLKYPDWIAMGNDVDEHGLTADARKVILGDETAYKKHMIEGKVKETRSYLRWEDPPLVQNGEGRISPAVPGCQTTVTVIGKNGKPLLLNHIFKIPDMEGAGREGQLAIDMAPIEPHTITKEARKCESCHTNPKSIGYGIDEGKDYADPGKPYIVDLTTADGKIIPKIFKTQINSIPNLHMDWSRFITEKGKQLQTVGHHYKLSRPLNNDERAKLDRRGVCLSCHQEIPEQDLAVSLLTHIREKTGIKIDNQMHNNILHKLVLMGAWGQVLGVIAFILAILTAFLWYRKRNE